MGWGRGNAASWLLLVAFSGCRGGAALPRQLLVMQSLDLEEFLPVKGNFRSFALSELCWVLAAPCLPSALSPMLLLSCLPGM